MMDPVGFAVDFTKNWSHPSHIVLFDSEEKQLRKFLVSHSFREVHAHSGLFYLFIKAILVDSICGSCNKAISSL